MTLQIAVLVSGGSFTCWHATISIGGTPTRISLFNPELLWTGRAFLDWGQLSIMDTNGFMQPISFHKTGVQTHHLFRLNPVEFTSRLDSNPIGQRCRLPFISHVSIITVCCDTPLSLISRRPRSRGNGLMSRSLSASLFSDCERSVSLGKFDPARMQFQAWQ